MTSTPLFREGHALVIGASQYKDSRWNASTAERDAEGVYEALVDPGVGGYPRGQVERLIGPQVTREGIQQGLRRLAERASPDSVAVISFTGHGALGEGEKLYYLGTSDAEFTGEGTIARNSGFHTVQLARALQAIQAQRVLVIINACFSGHLGEKLPEIGIGKPLPYERADELVNAGEGRVIITASRPDQKSFFDKTSDRSYFGQAVIDGLYGSQISQASGYIGVFDLYNAVYHQVRQITAGRGLAQEPVLTVLRGVGPFPVARYPGASGANRAALTQQAEVGAAVRVVERNQATITGNNNTTFQTGNNSPINIDYKRGIIIAGEGSQIGDITARDITEGNRVDIRVNGRPMNSEPEAAESEPKNPLDQLPRLAKRMETVNNVDVDDREEAALRITQGYRAYIGGNREKARERLTEALLLMRAMGNPFVDSLAKKVDAAIHFL